MSNCPTIIHNTNAACCTIPPVRSDYAPKGSYKPCGSFNRVYVTGAEEYETKLVCVYDAFGFSAQTQQGADIIASALKATVYMPDFFENKPQFPREKHPPKTEEDKAAIQAFFGSTANPPEATERLTSFGRVLRANGAKKLGAYGFCWGGKVTLCSGGASTPFDSVAIIHPSMLSSADAEPLTVPLAIYISKDESAEEYQKILNIVAKKPYATQSDHKYYSNMFHGWAAARGNLTDVENKTEFEDVYGRLVNFFSKTLA